MCDGAGSRRSLLRLVAGGIQKVDGTLQLWMLTMMDNHHASLP